MAMQKALHDLLKKTLGDEKSGDDKLLKIVSGWYETTEADTASIEKLEKANKELIEKRDASDTSEKELKEKVVTLEKSVTDKDAEIEKIKEGQLSDVERAEYLKTKKTGMTPDAEARFNKLEKNFTEIGEKLEASEKRAIEADESAKLATFKEKETALDNKVITALGDVKITGENAEMALLSMKSKGLYKLNNDDGAFSESFVTKDGGKELTATLSELCTDYASKHEMLVAPSGNVGSGNNHNTNPNNTTTTPNPQNLQEAQLKADSLMNG